MSVPAVESVPIEFRAVDYDGPAGAVLRDVSFALMPGAIAVVVGPTGTGKSTLLRLAAGELEPSRGDVRRAARRVAAFDQAWRRTSGERASVVPGWSIGEDRLDLLARRTPTGADLVVLDEPTRNLDPRSADALATMVRDLAHEGAAVLAASHDAAWSRAVASEALVISDSRVTRCAPAAVDFLAIHEMTLARLRG